MFAIWVAKVSREKCIRKRMIVTRKNPPNISKIRATFQVPIGAVFTYGAYIHNPDNSVITEDIIIHEKTHEIQQGSDPEAWWNLYMVDSQFRLFQEVEAYRNQYAFYCRKVKDRNKRDKFLRKLGNDLGSEMYGNIISVSGAMKQIKT